VLKKINNFKYLGVIINSSNNMHREIYERISNGNKCYYSINKLLRSKSLSRKLKSTLHTNYLRPISRQNKTIENSPYGKVKY